MRGYAYRDGLVQCQDKAHSMQAMLYAEGLPVIYIDDRQGSGHLIKRIRSPWTKESQIPSSAL